jgi:DNA invertase Pin-like site-specific DNA recombinase
MKTLAYLRISKNDQEIDNQRLAILDYAQRSDIKVDDFIEKRVSTRKAPAERGIDALLNQLEPGDTLLVSELSRLGRSLGEIIQTVNTLVKEQVRLIAIKERIELNGEQDIRDKILVGMIGLFAEIERDLISQRTREGLAAAKAKGAILGRPRGKRGKSKLDGREAEIRELLRKDVSKTAISKIMGCSRTTLCHFAKTRQLA